MERSEDAKDISTRENIKTSNLTSSSFDKFKKEKNLNLPEEGDCSFSTSKEEENSTIREANLTDYDETNENPSVMGRAGIKIVKNTQYHYFESYGIYYYLRNDGVLCQMEKEVFHELGKGIAVFGGSGSVWNPQEVKVIHLSCKEIIFCLVDEDTVYKYTPDGELFMIARNAKEYNLGIKQIENKLVAVERKRSKLDNEITPVRVDNIETGFKENCGKEFSTINRGFDTKICEDSKDIDEKMIFIVNRKLDENVEMEKGNFTLMGNRVENIDDGSKPVEVGEASKPVEEENSNISPKSSEDNFSSCISRSTKNKKSFLSGNILKYEISFPGLSIQDQFVDSLKNSMDGQPFEYSPCASARPTKNVSTHKVDKLARPSSEC